MSNTVEELQKINELLENIIEGSSKAIEALDELFSYSPPAKKE